METLIDAILDTDSPTLFYCLSYSGIDLNWPLENSSWLDLSLCLAARRPGCGQRYMPLARLTIPVSEAVQFLCHGCTLSSSAIKKFLNRQQTTKLLRPILELVTNIDSYNFDLRGLLSWHRTKVISAVKKLVKPIPSVNWLIATFGTSEAEFVLTASTYFFSNIPCSRETIQHLVSLFIGDDRGRSLISVGTFGEIAPIIGPSKWQCSIPLFWKFLKVKLESDDLEMAALDTVLNRFRGNLFMSKEDTLRFLYIGFFQCLNRTSFERYTLSTGTFGKVSEHLNSLKNAKIDGILSSSLDSAFKQRMETYFNKTDFLTQHTVCASLDVPDEQILGYSLSEATGIKAWIGQSRELATFLGEIRETLPFMCLSEDLSGLLTLASASEYPLGSSPEDSAQMTFLSTLGRFPVFRTEFNGSHYFSLMIHDTLEAHWRSSIHFGSELVGEFLNRRHQRLQRHTELKTQRPSATSDPGHIECQISGDDGCEFYMDEELLTKLIFYDDPPQASNIGQQLFISRHEIFNPHIPVFNLVLDFDLEHTSHTRMPSLHTLLRVCQLLRGEILDALELLGHVDKETHYVLFFKSTCPPLPVEVENTEDLYCTCQEKLGLRIITQLPPGVVLVGSETVIGLVKVINRLIKLNSEICDIFPQIRREVGPFDLGVYHSGRSIRIPHTFKVTSGQRPSKQLRILVTLPPKGSFHEYLRRCLTLSCLLHHGQLLPDKALNQRLIFKVIDRSEDFLERKSVEHLPRACNDIPARIEGVTGQDLVAWITDYVWPDILRSIRLHLQDDRVAQFQNVFFEPGGGNIVVVKPRRGRYFSCLNYSHKNKAQTVRIFLALHSTNSNVITITLMSQCFSSKCNSNRSTPHFSIVKELVSTEAQTTSEAAEKD